MKLFFETSQQAERFLCLIPLGFLLAAILDLNSSRKMVRIMIDTVLFILVGLFMNLYAMMFRESGLRGYHMLSFLVGVILYMCGIGRLTKCNKHRNNGKKKTVEAGKKETNKENRSST